MLQAAAKEEGFGLVTRRSEENKLTKEIYKVEMVCNRSSTYKARPAEEQRIRKTSSRKTACPFRVHIIKYQNEVQWSVYMMCEDHNHELSEKPKIQAVHRRNEMTEEMLDTIAKATESLQTPKQIHTNIRKKHPRTGITIQDVYNAKKKIKHRKLGKHTPTQALLKALNKDCWFVKFYLDPKTKRVKRLFFVNKHIREILCKNSEVIIMDCTYKTNKYRMPLLIIMGFTALGTSFYIAKVFLDGEEFEDFNWAIEQLKELYVLLGLKGPVVIVTDRDLALMNAIEVNYPEVYNILCVWHINRNVLKNCKAAFATQEDWEEFLAAWHAVVYAHTPAEYEEAWKRLETQYREEHEEEVDYLQTTWLNEHKERFCKAWTNEVLHFNTLTTSRVESGHRVLKSVLKFSTGDLHTVVSGLETLLEGQHDDYTTKLADAKELVAYNLPRELMRDLIPKISPYALQKIRKQWKLVKKSKLDPDHEAYEELGPCSGVFATTMGLPCSHMIKACMEAPNPKLSLDDVHSHWWIKKPATSNETTTDPLIIDNASYWMRRAAETESSDDLPELNELLAGPSSRMEPRPASPPSENEAENINNQNIDMRPRSPSPASEPEDLADLLEINEPAKIKAKGRPKGSINKKGTMTKAEKKAANSTKRDLSGFEHVERNIEARAKRAKKEAAAKPKAKAKAPRKKAAAASTKQGRGGRGGRGGAASRSANTASQALVISSDEDSDDGFRNLDVSSSDEDFNASKDGDEIEGDDWMD